MLVLAAYAVTSVGPRGAILCLGGGHAWSEVIAAACIEDPSGHRHGAKLRFTTHSHVQQHDACSEDHSHTHASCTADDHHDDHRHCDGHSEEASSWADHCNYCVHHHSGTHGPCTDVPLGAEEARPNAGKSLTLQTASADDASQPSVSFAVHRFCVLQSHRSWTVLLDTSQGMAQVTASLRAVRLLI